jgi:HlyD family secretion protein
LTAAVAFSFMPKPVPVETWDIESGAMTVTIDEDGRTRVVDHYVLSAPLHGMLPRLELSAGDRVEEGKRIATMESIRSPLMDARNQAQAEARLKASQAALRQANASIERARVAHVFAKDELARVKPLVEAGTLARRALEVAELDLHSRAQELESAKFGARVARYEVETAKASVGRFDSRDPGVGEQVEITSPIDGEVLRILKRDEGVVSAGTPLLELADPDHLEVVADVLTSDAVRIERGDRVSIEGWGGDRTIEGAVLLVEPSAFTKVSALGVEEQRVNVVIEIVDDDLDGVRLGDGFRVEVRIAVWSGDDVVKVPISAMFRDGDEWAVFCVVDGRAQLRKVEIGKRQGLDAQVLSGLEAGERVVVHPHDTVVDGVEILLDD